MHRDETDPSGRRATGVLLTLTLAAAAMLALPTAPVAAAADDPTELALVALTGPGTSEARGGSGEQDGLTALRTQQDEVLRAVGAGEPTYRWTTALNGFAVRVTEDQVTALRNDPRVAAVEANRVLPLASRPTSALASSPPLPSTRARGGAGTVIGIVDSGIAADSPVFAAVPGLGPDPTGFTGTCGAGDGWAADSCNRKLVGARWFVEGFGADRLRTTEQLSAADDLGHGTQVASVAAGNAGVSVRIAGRDRGEFGGVAPQARVAAYKACWAAPDPAQDGCATADVVAAIDAAVGDGVDVLNLAAGGGESDGIDIIERALLGAAEADVVVVGAAGNDPRSYAAHAAPWVTTVGASTGGTPRGTVALPGGRRLVGGGRPAPVAGRLIDAGSARAAGARVLAARQCRPGALDAARLKDAIVVCQRGGIGRIDKSAAVKSADGAAMILVNTRPGGVSADFHSVPTVHLTAGHARILERRMDRSPRLRARLLPTPGAARVERVAGWSPDGDPRGFVVKPDALAAGDNVLGAVPGSSGRGWATFSGSSAASARAAGLAALLRGRTRLSASVVRSLLTTTATPVPGSSVLAQGGGVLGDVVPRSNLALEVSPRRWRRALEEGRLSRLNTSSVLLPPSVRSATRRVTNVSTREEYFSVTAAGFDSHRVEIRPLAVRLAPGESARFTITVAGPRSVGRLDDGYVVWLGARGGTTRLPVALTR